MGYSIHMNNIEHSKRSQLADAFKQHLRCGKWAAGSRLPTRTELVKSFKISPMTLQLVIDDLTRDGFVESRGRQGTFAVPTPPFTRNYAFVINGLSEERHTWIHFWRVLEAEASKLFGDSQKQAVFFYGIDTPLSTEMTRLAHEIESNQLAGVFFSRVPTFLAQSPLLSQKHTPLVAVGSKSDSSQNLSLIKLGTDRFFEDALREIKAAGRRRVGLITPWEDPRQHLADFFSKAAQQGLETNPRWCQYAPHSIGGRRWAANAAQAIVTGTERPDALVIYDDNLIESTMAGLQAANCNVPSECLVVAHTNFPWPIASPYPLIRIGVDIRKLVLAAVSEIDRRQTASDPHEIRIPLQTLNELEPV